ncbi:MAG: rhodanese-like domain-containing protein [Thermoplasmataceae archaeon]
MSIRDYFKNPKELKEIEPYELEKKRNEGIAKIIDVRTKREYSNGHINGIENIPLRELKKMVGSFDVKDDYVLICATGHRSRAAANLLLRNGVKNVSHLKSGMRSWKGKEAMKKV